MKKYLLFLVLALGLIANPAFSAVLWEDDMNSLAPWSESSQANPEEGDGVGGIRVVGGNRVQMNAYWDGAKQTNMWRGTPVAVLSLNTAYFATFTMESYKDVSKNVTVNMQNVTDGWSVIVAEAFAPSKGDFTDYSIVFTTTDGQNHDAIGDQIGIGINAGWWNNVGIDHITLEYLAAEPNLPANDSNLTDNQDLVGDPGTTGVDVDLQWYTMRDPNLTANPDLTAINPDVTKHYLYYVEAEPTGDDPNWASPSVSMITIAGPITDVVDYTLQDLNFGSGYYWRVDESIKDSGPSDPNTVIGVSRAFETIPEQVVLLSQPQDVLVEDGGSGDFQVDYLSLSPATFTWYHSDDQVQDPFGDTLIGSGVDANSITLTDISLADGDEQTYVYCIANNGGADVFSEMALVEIERLAGQWQMDGNLSDSSGYNWDGSAVTTVSYDTDRKSVANNALSLGDDPNHVQIAGSEDAFNFYHLGLTINAWIKKSDSNWSGIVCKQDRDGYSPWAGFVFNVRGNGVLSFNMRGAGGPDGDTAVNDDQWHMVTATYNGATGEYAVYVDGELDGSMTDPDTPLKSENVVTIGAEQFTGSTAFAGLIDQVEIYTYAKTQAEVLDLYNATEDPDKSLCLNPYASAADIWPVGNPDCKVDINDFAEMAAGWMSCGLYPDCQ